MRILAHDYSGHPFQAQLSRELARRGHQVTHSFCDAHQTGKGKLVAEQGETVVFDPIAVGDHLEKLRFGKRLFKELKYGLQLLAQVRRVRPDVVMIGNAPVPTMTVAALGLLALRTPWAFWQQDVQAVAARSFAGKQLSRWFRAVAAVMELLERWCARRAKSIVVICESFRHVHERWDTASKVAVIPNWAPLDEILPLERRNSWSREHELDECKTLLYSGTLGLKHDPALLARLARNVIDAGQPVRLVVVSEGPAVAVLRDEADKLAVPLTLLPFQPYGRLSEVLGSGDILVVLLEQDAGAFSVPSKTLSYLCAGRPVLGLMPAENLAASLVREAEGCVLPPRDDSLDAAAEWVSKLLVDPVRAADIGDASRLVAEREFALEGCADRFEAILLNTATGAGTT
jgi:colanic acid biosynthesis glycosyl transferase WcaI